MKHEVFFLTNIFPCISFRNIHRGTLKNVRGSISSSLSAFKCYLQQSYSSEHKRYRLHEFIIISIEDSTKLSRSLKRGIPEVSTMAEPPREESGERQEPQVPQGPQPRVIQDIVVPQEGQPPQDDSGQLEVVFSLRYFFMFFVTVFFYFR